MESLTIVKTVHEFTPTCGHKHLNADKCIDCNDNCDKRQHTEESLYDDLNICLSTKYYRKNKVSRGKIHKCPHCDYETTGPKQTLINHINAKHIAEKDKPFYCSCCNKITHRLLMPKSFYIFTIRFI